MIYFNPNHRVPECYSGNNKHSDRDFRPKLRVNVVWEGGGLTHEGDTRR